MRALTVQQPWAGLIASSAKTVENRSWPPPRAALGHQVAIHAGKTTDTEAARRFITDRTDSSTALHLIARPACQKLGSVIAVAMLSGAHLGGRYDCQECTSLDSAWAVSESWHWCLRDVVALAEPVPARGLLGLWELSEEVESLVRQQLPAPPPW